MANSECSKPTPQHIARRLLAFMVVTARASLERDAALANVPDLYRRLLAWTLEIGIAERKAAPHKTAGLMK